MDHQRAESIMCFILDDVEISNFINTDPYQELIIVSFVKTGYYNCLYRLIHNQHLEKPCLQLSHNCLAHFFGAINEYKFKIATLIFERFHHIFETKADELAEYLRESSPYIKAKSIEIIKKNSSCKELLALIEQLSYKKQKSVSMKGREATTVIFSKQGSSEIDEQNTSQKKSPSETSLRK